MKDLTYLSTLNLNHLLVLVAVMRTGSVTEAARQLKRSQSAVSHALSRLREDLDDPLFVRAGLQLVATPRAEEIAEGLEELLPSLSTALNPPGDFDPEESEVLFKVASEDLIQHHFTAPLVQAIEQRASGAQLVIAPLPSQKDLSERLSHDLDVALTTEPLETSSNIHNSFIASEPLSCVIRANHPNIGSKSDLSIKDYGLLRHVLVSPSGQASDVVDTKLDDRGMRRRISLTLPNLLSVGDVISSSNLVATLPTRFAQGLVAQRDDLAIIAPPSEISDASIYMVWHERLNNDPSQVWLRSLISGLFPKEQAA